MSTYNHQKWCQPVVLPRRGAARLGAADTGSRGSWLPSRARAMTCDVAPLGLAESQLSYSLCTKKENLRLAQTSLKCEPICGRATYARVSASCEHTYKYIFYCF